MNHIKSSIISDLIAHSKVELHIMKILATVWFPWPALGLKLQSPTHISILIISKISTQVEVYYQIDL